MDPIQAPFEIVDLSVPFSEGMPKYDAPWFPAFEIQEIQPGSMSEARWKRRFTTLNLFAHNGTHVEGTDHVFSDGNTIDRLPLSRFVGNPLIVDLMGLPDRTEIGSELIESRLAGHEPNSNTIVLIRTGYNDRNWGRPEFWTDSPYLSKAAATLLADSGAGFFGLDFQTEKPGEKEFVVHRTLLSRPHAVLCEYLFNLAQATPDSLFLALPISIRNVEASPVRAVVLKPVQPQKDG